MKKFLRYPIILIIVCLIGYNIWSASGRKSPPSITQETCSTEQEVFGTNSGLGNLIGIQPKLSPTDFASEINFFNKIDSYLKEAQQASFFTDRSVVVFPEYIGTWLVAVDEKQAVYTAPNLQEAMKIMVNSNLGNFLISYAAAPKVKDKTAYSLFMMKSEQMAAIYHRTFSRLANKYQVTIVAGSIVLPNPQIKNNQLITGSGDLYNVTVIYQPKGTPYPQIIKKVFLTSDEQPFTSVGKLTEPPIFPLPIGNTAILICTDSWFPETYQHLENTEVIIVPSYCSKENSWSQVWQGYSDYSTPNDVDKADIGTLTQEQAWLKYSLAERIKTTKARVGMNVFLRGQLWGLGSDGFPILVKDGKAIQGLRVRGASITCLWL
ncbi:MAG: putative amidohydrolase [bacterium]|nr:MAG: putative amidohydrolase [bacterium]